MDTVRGLIGALAGEEFVENQAEGINIAAGSDCVAAELLRRHVTWSAVPDLGAGKLVGDGGQTEIHDDDLSALVDHDVLRFEVAMDHVTVVGGGESGTELTGGLDGFIGGEPADAGEEGRKVFAIHVFHGDERRAIDHPDIVDAADVGVGDHARDADFSVEAFKDTRVLGGLGRQEFKGDGLSEGEVGGPIDFAHAAAAEKSDDAIAAGEESARDEAALVGEGTGGDGRKRSDAIRCRVRRSYQR